MAGHIATAKSVEWNTPQWIVDGVMYSFNDCIDLDPASNVNSIVLAGTKFSLPDKDGLVEDWSIYENIYINPPFGYDKVRKTRIYHWIKKGFDLKDNNLIYCIPAAIDTKHWQDIIWKNYTSICFIKGRVKFIGAKSCAPMPIALIGKFKDNDVRDRFEEYFEDYGHLLIKGDEV